MAASSSALLSPAPYRVPSFVPQWFLETINFNQKHNMDFVAVCLQSPRINTFREPPPFTFIATKWVLEKEEQTFSNARHSARLNQVNEATLPASPHDPNLAQAISATILDLYADVARLEDAGAAGKVPDLKAICAATLLACLRRVLPAERGTAPKNTTTDSATKGQNQKVTPNLVLIGTREEADLLINVERFYET